MSVTYQELLAETLPKRIENDVDYDRFHRRLGELMRLRRRSAAETKLFHLLVLLIQDYDRRHALPPDDSTPAERLQYLLEVSGKKPVDLLPVFGQRSHVNEALTGKRPISTAQARKLGEIFRLKAGYFV
jgi:antitoxin component HigA of HigAB toxin-antitoxin module